MRKTYFKKSISLIMTVLMVMSTWVFFVSPVEAEAAKESPIGGMAVSGQSYVVGRTDKYGTPMFDGNLDRWIKWTNNADDYVKVKYPANIYLDKSESLDSAGYFFNVDWHFGHHTDYRIYIGSNVWGDHIQSGSNHWSGKPDSYYTMTNIFENYSIDASNPQGATIGVYGNGVSDSDADTKLVGYGVTDGFWYQDVRHEKFLRWKSNGTSDPNLGTIFLKGNIKSSTAVGTYEYNTANAGFPSYGWQQNYSGGKWKENENTMFQGKGGGANSVNEQNPNCTSSLEEDGGWVEMRWKITIYDKSALNSAISNAQSYVNNSARYTYRSIQALQNAISTATSVLKTRAVTQSQLDAQITALNNAIGALEDKKFEITYENLFSVSDWWSSKSAVDGTNRVITVDHAAGKITVKNTASSGEVFTEHSSSSGRNASNYSMPVTGNKQYTFKYTTDGGDTQLFAFFYDANGNCTHLNDTSAYHFYVNGGTGQATFTAPANSARVEIRLDNNTAGTTANFWDIEVYDTARAEAIDYENWLVKPERYVYSYSQNITSNFVPSVQRKGYAFNTWYFADETAATPLSNYYGTNLSNRTGSHVAYSDWKAIDVSYDNLFSLDGWVGALPNNNTNHGTWSADLENGSVSISSVSGQDNNVVSWNYDIPVEENTEYIFEYDAEIESGSGTQVHLFCMADTGATSWISFPENGVYQYTSGKKSITFTTPAGTKCINVRLGTTTATGVTNTFSNIALYKTADAEKIQSITNREYRINTPMSGADLYTPERVGYIFKGWYYDADYTSAVSADDTFSANTTVYAKWNLYPNDINYENYFSLSDWANSNCVLPNGTGKVEVDITNDSFTYTPSAAYETLKCEVGDSAFYNMTLEPNETYVIEIDVTPYAYVELRTVDGALLGNNCIWGGANTSGTQRKEFTPTQAEVYLALGTAGDESQLVPVTFSNIRVYKKADEERLASYSGLKVRDIISADLVLNVPTMAGYQFEGWYTDEARTDKVTDVAALKNSTTVFSNWTANNYTIAFNGNGGTYQGSNVSAVYDSQAVLPATGAARTGYTFAGWNTQANGEGTVYQGGSEVLNLTDENNGVVTLYAMWTANEYTIIFDGNGNDSGATASQTVNYGVSAELNENGFIKDGYTFNGWTTRQDGSGTKYADGAEVQNLTADANSSITLYAQWKVNNYTISFNNNGGVGVMEDVNATYDVDVTLDECRFSKTGYSFSGWNTEADGNGISYTDGATVKNLTTEAGATVTLYAQWDVGTYEVIFNPNGGAGEAYSQHITYDEETALSENTFTREGYIFAGWNTASGGNGDKFSNGALVRNLTTTSITLFAQWTAVEYKITFNGNGNDGGATADIDPVKYDNPVNLNKNGFTKTGYTFSGWNTEADGSGEAYVDQESVVNLASGQDETATLYAQWTPNTYTIRFNRNDGIGSMDSITATYDATYTLTLNQYNRVGYTFTGWNTQEDGNGTAYSDGDTVTNLTAQANATVTLYAQWKINTYDITWVDGNGEVLYTETLDYGTVPSYDGDTPAKTADAQYTYTFNNAWSPAIVAVSADATYTAQFDTTVNKYTIKFVNEDGTVLQTGEVEYGATPAYEGETPTKAADKQYTYFFNTWEPAITSVTGEATYKATYNQTVNKYTITWVDGDGNTIKTDSVDYGTVPSYVGDTPTKTATAEFTYTFKGWKEELVPVTDDATYNADFDSAVNQYTVKFVNDDGTVLSEQTLDYGATPVYGGDTPTKAGDAEFTYTFKGWDKEITAVTENVTYTAEYDSDINEYTVKFVDEDGTALYETTVAYGDMPVYAGDEPTKAGNDEFTWTFTGWTPELAPVTGDAVYTAVYNSEVKKYAITWVDGDGNTIKTDSVAYGTVPSYEGAAPTKTATAQYTYTFKGWVEELVAVTGDATYNADFDSTVNQYTVTFVDEDELTILDKQTLDYGATPVYGGEAPTKTGDAEFTWSFAGWDKEIATVTDDVIYKATYESTTNTYTVTWLDENGDELEKDTAVAYGTLPKFDGEEPTKAGDAELSWSFIGWDKEIVAVTGDVTYTAKYESSVNEYTIIFLNENGDELDKQTVKYGETPVYGGEAPTKAATAEFTYTFIGWNEEIAPVTGDATYTAEYESSVNEYTIKFVDEDGVTVLDEQILEYGETPEYKGEAPTKETTDEYIYTFIGWTPEIAVVTGTATYTAVYEQKSNSYKVTFKNEDGSVLYEENFKYGETPVYGGETPTKASDVQYDYTFAGWDKAFEAVTSDDTYTATYDKALRSYTITFVYAAGTSKEITLEYGSSYRKLPNTLDWQTDADHYTYSWPELPATVTGDATYTEIESKTPHTVIYADDLDDAKHTIGCEYCPWTKEAAHSWDYGNITDEATCTEAGSMVYTCADCGGEKTEEIPPMGHVTETVPGYAAGCLTDGLTDGTKCSVCDTTLVGQVAIPATGHADEEPVDGYCDNCGEFICEHKDITTKRKDPTCTEKGEIYNSCNTCGTVFETEYIDALGHVIQVETVEATCIEYAHTITTCSKCDMLNEKAYIGDTYADHKWIVVPGKAPTCVEEGYSGHNKCSVCGLEGEITKIPTVSHNDGNGDGHCDICGGEYSSGNRACGCICHKDNFIMRIFYAIAKVFWKLFKINYSCACGNTHY